MTLVALVSILIAQCELLCDSPFLLISMMIRLPRDTSTTPVEFPHMIVELSCQEHLQAVAALHS